ncbi:unnamed protein product, partial [Coregonus sp. 'balchen']
MVMFLGDFNADCGYLAKKNRQHVRLYSNQAFLIVVHGEAFANAIVPQSARPFNFAEEYHLTEEQ